MGIRTCPSQNRMFGNTKSILERSFPERTQTKSTSRPVWLFTCLVWLAENGQGAPAAKAAHPKPEGQSLQWRTNTAIRLSFAGCPTGSRLALRVLYGCALRRSRAPLPCKPVMPAVQFSPASGASLQFHSPLVGSHPLSSSSKAGSNVSFNQTSNSSHRHAVLRSASIPKGIIHYRPSSFLQSLPHQPQAPAMFGKSQFAVASHSHSARFILGEKCPEKH